MLIAPDSVLTLEKINLSNRRTDDILNGRLFTLDMDDGFYSVYGRNEFIGVGFINEGVLKIKSYIKD